MADPKQQYHSLSEGAQAQGSEELMDILEGEELNPENLQMDFDLEIELKEESHFSPGFPFPGSGSGTPSTQEQDRKLDFLKDDLKDSATEDSELEAIIQELKKMHRSSLMCSADPVIWSTEQATEDARSIYVGNVDYGATAQELEAHFHGCGLVNRVTIACDKFSGHPKGFAYIEFSDQESMKNSLALDESLFRGREIKVMPKRTNIPGISTTDRGFPRAQFCVRGTNYHGSCCRFYSGFHSSPLSHMYRGQVSRARGSRGQFYRGKDNMGQGRGTSWYSPY